MGYAQAVSLIMYTNINHQIYMYIDASQQERIFLPNYPENLKYAMCICYTLDEAVHIWYKVLLCSVVTVPISGKHHFTVKS